MSNESPTIQSTGRDDSTQRGADAAAVLKHLVSGKPIDPAILERVRARAEQVTAEIRRDRGLVDDDTFQSLLDDET